MLAIHLQNIVTGHGKPPSKKEIDLSVADTSGNFEAIFGRYILKELALK